MISDDGGWRRLEFERIEVGWDPIHSSKASSALAFQSWKNGENKFISIKIFSRQRRDLHLPASFFFFFHVANREAHDSRTIKWIRKWVRQFWNVFTVIRYWDDCSVYTTCEYAFPQRRRNYADDSICANKLENFLENPRDEGCNHKEKLLPERSSLCIWKSDWSMLVSFHRGCYFFFFTWRSHNKLWRFNVSCLNNKMFISTLVRRRLHIEVVFQAK